MYEKSFFLYESSLAWGDITSLRKDITQAVLNSGYNKKLAEIMTLICSELLENTFKHTSKRIARLEISSIEEKNILAVTMDNPIDEMNSKQLSILEQELDRINSYTDMQKLYLESLLRSATLSQGESKLGFSLIRKISNGSRIEFYGSSHYSPGVQFRVNMEVSHFDF